MGAPLPGGPAAMFDAALNGQVPLSVGRWCSFRETHWSYRQPISYEVHDSSGTAVATVLPIDPLTRTTSVVRVGGQARLVLTVDRRGGTAVTTLDGRTIGRFSYRLRIGRHRLDISTGQGRVGSLEQDGLRADLAAVLTVDGAPVALVRRAADGRFAGAAYASTELVAPAPTIPAALLFAAAPALDATRRRRRS